MKVNIYIKVKGPGGEMESPSTSNPYKVDNLKQLVGLTYANWPELVSGIEITGIRFEEVSDD